MGLKLESHSLIGLNLRKSAGNPGSGTYQPDYKTSKKKMPAFSMGGKHKSAQRSRAPGPGAYETHEGSPVKKSAPRFGFGTEPQRTKLHKTSTPGPGIYLVPSTIGNMPSYTGARTRMAYV